jgi:alpha-tubulin suppressor-like RCC1 family protein
VTTSNIAYCWGSNGSGELGDGTFIDSEVPVAVSGLTFSSVDTGTGHTCGVTTSGAMHCWGDNTNGKLGDGTTLDRSVPTEVSGGLIWTEISAGAWFNCGLADALYCWGTNTSGELGDGTTTNRTTPVRVVGQP